MSRSRGEGGAMTVLVLASAGLLMLLAAALAVVTALVAAHRSAQSAADLSALAGARALAASQSPRDGGDGCASARQVAAANGARLVSCSVTGRTIEVSVEVTGPHWLGQRADLRARSRAGPAGPAP